jgi:Ca2+-transporting ATPase
MQIGLICIVLVLFVFGLGIFQGIELTEILLISLTLIVSTLPNSLPLVVTVGLTMGSQRLAKQNMLIKRLPAAESLGAATIICTDKTGTLTKNQMTAVKIYTDEKTFDVSGIGYEPVGNIYLKKNKIETKVAEVALKIGYLCNNARLSTAGNRFDIIGDPTEGALVVLGVKGGVDKSCNSHNYHLLKELPFDSDRKMMSKIFDNKKQDAKEAYIKGAPDIVVDLCTKILDNGVARKINSDDKARIHQANESFGREALRVLALAYRDVSHIDKFSIGTVEKDMVFVGLVGMIDPPREEVRPAIEKCYDAGIEVMMITGDHPVTAKAVSEHIGLFKKGDLVLTGEEIDRMTDKELDRKLDKIRIIARALPIQKSRIVSLLQKKGHIVAMTGDGVNDAPALKKADIGIAMGVTGTDVAKSVAKATLLDDNFATIVNAIETGRNIYDSLIRSAKFFLSCNSGEIYSVLIALMLNFPLPLIPLQLLLMNMLTDNLPALGLGFEVPEEGIMKRKPRDPKEQPLSNRMLISINIFGILMSLGTLTLFLLYYKTDVGLARTVAFTTLVMFQMFAVISSRTLLPSLRHLNLSTNPWLLGGMCLAVLIHLAVLYYPPLQSLFGTVALAKGDWVKIIAVSSSGFILMELSKFFTFQKA